MDAEIGVIGLGTVGSMTLWQLAKKGVSVMGFEQYGIGHDNSAAGGESRLFRTAYGEGREYVPLLQAAQKEWRELEAASGNTLLELHGGLMIGNPDTPFMQNVIKSATDFNLAHRVLNHEEAAKEFPQHSLTPGDVMILDEQAGYIRPELSVLSAVKQAESHGAKVHSYTQVEDIKEVKDKVQVTASGKTYTFNKVIITAGPWLNRFYPEMSEHIEIRRLALAWFIPKHPERFTASKFPIFIREKGDVKYYGTPTLDGTMVKVGLYKNFGVVKDPDSLHRTIHPDDLAPMREIVKEFMPDLHPDPVRVSAYMDLFTADEHSLVGKVPGKNNLVVAGGFSGHGFKLSPMMGKIAADIALEKEIPFQIKHLSPARF